VGVYPAIPPPTEVAKVRNADSKEVSMVGEVLFANIAAREICKAAAAVVTVVDAGTMDVA